MLDIARRNAAVMAALFTKFKDLKVSQKKEERMTNIPKHSSAKRKKMPNSSFYIFFQWTEQKHFFLIHTFFITI